MNATPPTVSGSSSAPTSLTTEDRCLEKLAYISGRMSGLAGTARYTVAEGLREEIADLAQMIADAADLLEKAPRS